MTSEGSSAVISPPANVKLTRLQKQVLAYVRKMPRSKTWQIAIGIDHRPYYVVHALEALERFRYVVKKDPDADGWPLWELL